MTNATLVFDDANSELLDIVSAADVDAEERVDYSFVGILKPRFGRDFESESVTILKLKFGQDLKN